MVEFHGTLQERVTKEIEITNPTGSSIIYTVHIDGSTDFNLTEHTLHLEPKSSKKFPVTFTGRFSKSAEAKLLFTSKRKGPYQQGR